MTSSSQALILIHKSNNSLIYYQPTNEYDRPVVVKVLNTNFPTPNQLIHFNNEYEFTKDLAVDSVRKAIAQTRIEDKPALVLEYMTGQTLRQAFVEQRQPLVDLLRVAVHIAQALGELHQHHIIHRDINSQNILVNLETKQVKLIDFGLASRIDLRVQHLGNPEGLAGTLAYISPEQTGRMNRKVDYRTDLYSLGVTFYEMLTGHLPFESDDPLALVHAHLAKAPRPVTALNPDVPAILSDIVLKLLAKNAEDRYQSALGLQADLERCLAYLQDPKGLKDPWGLQFSLGQEDYSGQFHLPQKLYGRSTEIATLLAAFERAAAGSQELMLVAGYPGVGKSALAAEVHKPITEKRGYFISGKFDQYQQHTPYAAFSQAFNQLADLLLTEREATLQQWRDKILAAASGNGAVLTEVIPRLEKVIGSQPAVTQLGGQENRNRFHLTFQNFVQAISTAEHPLVVFIDDWQWADLASLELLKVLLTKGVSTHLLLIGAYRDKEVDRTHPFITTLNDLATAGVALQTIQLGNLQVEDVQQLIQESLACSTADSQALTELVYDKTEGNAFFTRQFLQNLYEEGWLHFDFNTRHWRWDIAQLKAQNITDNVVDLMTAKLKRLSRQTAHLLQLAACIGNEFDLQTLALISQTSEPTTLTGLTEALTQGLVLPQDDYYKLPATAAQARFRFLHDRVQQAAYAQIPAPERQTVHLEIGRLLLADSPAATLEQQVFDIVRHYHQVGPLVTTETERLRLVELNMQAADLASRAAAFRSAQVYLEAALALMPADAWASRYDEMLRLHSQLATVFSLTGDFERLDQVFQITAAQAQTLTDTAQVKLAKIQGLLSRGSYPEAIELGLAFIEALGVPISRNPSSEEAFTYLQETAEWLTPARINMLRHLPAASAEVGLIIETAVTINGPVFGSNMNLCFVFVSQITRLCIEQGLAPWAPVTLATFALLLSAALHDIPKARLLTDATMQLYAEKYPVDSLVPYLSVPVGGFVMHRYAHLKHTLPIFANGVQKGLLTGAFLFDSYCAWWYAWHHLFLGVPLAQVETVSQQAVETCQKIQMERLKDWCLLVHQATLNLQGKNETPWLLKGETYDEQDMLALAVQVNDFAEVFRIFFYRAWLHYLFDQPQAAVKLFQEAETYSVYGVGLYVMPLFYFYDALANAAIYNDQTPEEQSQILERIKRNLAQLEVWVRFAPMNHQHKQDLLEAEKARLEGCYWQAVTYYEKAIRGARENEFLHEEALAYELCGKFWLEQDHPEIASVYLQKAQNLYGLWGAAAKVEQLQATFGQGLGPRPSPPQDRLDTLRLTPSISQPTTSNLLDINSLLKANQTLSQAVQLADLLTEMIKILLENAGAERALILYQAEEGWFIEAEGQVQDQAIQTGLHLPLSEAATLPLSIFNYVIHSGQAIVLANAAQDPQFGTDTYLREHKVKSILCLPIWHKGALKLVLYLENNLIGGAFTESRLELLQLLSGQMAISLENALMVDSLKTSIAERKQAEIALRESEERFRLFMHHFPGLAYIKDVATRVLFANQGFMTYLNITPAELLGKTNQEIFPPEFAEQITADDLRLFESGQSQQIEEHYGGRIWSTYKFILPQPDRPPLLGGFTLDITERKRAEAQLERNLRETRIRFEVSQALAGAETEDEVLDVLIQHADLYPQARGSIFTFDRTGGELAVILRRPDDPSESGVLPVVPVGARFPVSHFTVINLLSADQPFVSNDVWADERVDPDIRELFRQIGNTSLSAFPLTIGNEWLGFIAVSAKPPGYFDEEKQHLYQTLAEQGAVALHAARLREAVRASQQRLLLLVQQSPLAVIEWDIDFRVVLWNPAAEQIFGYTNAEALGHHMADLIVPAAARPLVDRVWRDLLAQKGDTHSANDNLTKAGQIITCEWFNTPLVGADGRVIGVASLVQDITERKRVEAELRTSETRYRALVQSQLDLISRYLPDTTLTFVNDAYCRFYGKTREELIGQSYLIMVAPEFHEQALQETENFLKDPRPISGEYLNYRWDGQECWIHWILQGIVDDKGRVVEIQASGRDITPLKQAEEEIRRLNEELEQRVIERTAQLEAANKELEAFSYSVSHDLRAPLRAIDGYTRILVEDYEAALDAEGKRVCDVIRDRTQRMDQLINDLLVFSRLSRAQMQTAPIDMASLVTTLFQELTTPEDRERLDFQLDPLPPALGDPALIRQVWVNLLANAIKFSAKRERAVIEVSGRQDDIENIYFVRDNGAGFDPQYADKLFGVFQRLHSEQEFAGTGVGLAIVQRIIQRHGGRVWAESEPDQGATFYFTLPQLG